ncbi:MAG: hypothetical protein ACRDZ4_03080 [Egibacteraceae bacterium]
MGKIRHMLVLVLAVGALVALSAAPALADDDDRDRDRDRDDHYDRGTRPCGSLFDILEGDGGDCGVLNPLTGGDDDRDFDGGSDFGDEGHEGHEEDKS